MQDVVTARRSADCPDIIRSYSYSCERICHWSPCLPFSIFSTNSDTS